MNKRIKERNAEPMLALKANISDHYNKKREKHLNN
jgi:hypothetical protein